MILTHILVLLAATPVAVSPSPAMLAIGDGGTAVARPRRALALLPAVSVPAPAVLAVRGD
jgi:hypothetical protein